jgi:hypothetical protein
MPLRLAFGAVLLLTLWSATARLTADIPDAANLAALTVSDSQTTSDYGAEAGDVTPLLLSERHKTAAPTPARFLSPLSTATVQFAAALDTMCRDGGGARPPFRPLLI